MRVAGDEGWRRRAAKGGSVTTPRLLTVEERLSSVRRRLLPGDRGRAVTKTGGCRFEEVLTAEKRGLSSSRTG